MTKIGAIGKKFEKPRTNVAAILDFGPGAQIQPRLLEEFGDSSRVYIYDPKKHRNHYIQGFLTWFTYLTSNMLK